MIDGVAVTVTLAVIGGVVWLVRLEGRINGHDRENKQTREDLTYIRERIDRALDQRER